MASHELPRADENSMMFLGASLLETSLLAQPTTAPADAMLACVGGEVAIRWAVGDDGRDDTGSTRSVDDR